MLATDYFSVPKKGNSEEENDDAWSYSSDPVSKEMRAAVADGATESLFSGYWASLLSSAYSTGLLTAEKFSEVIAELSQLWDQHAGRKPLPWYAVEKLAYGGFAALVGVTFQAQNGDESRPNWYSFAIGDSCLFQVRDNILLKATPLNSPEEFNNSPALISSKADSNKDLAFKFETGTWQAGDRFFLLSDALACWFLKQSDPGEAADRLTELKTQDEFATLVAYLRSADNGFDKPCIRNDDTTMVRVIALG